MVKYICVTDIERVSVLNKFCYSYTHCYYNYIYYRYYYNWGWLGGAMVLGKLSVPGRPTNLDKIRARAYCACSRRGLFGHFSLIYHFSLLSPSLWETARYRLKDCLKGPLSPKQLTNHYYYSYYYFRVNVKIILIGSILVRVDKNLISCKCVSSVELAQIS